MRFSPRFDVWSVEADRVLAGIYTARRILLFKTRLLTMEMVRHTGIVAFESSMKANGP